MKTSALIRTVALAAFAMSIHVTFADDTTKPDQPDKTDPGNIIKIDKNKGKFQKLEVKRPADPLDPNGVEPKIIFQPDGPATQPAEIKPNVTAEAQKLVDKIVEAYGKLKSLELTGTFSGEIEAAGQRNGGKIPFATSFKSPNQYRHDAKDDVLIGSTGEKAYLYASQDHIYSQADAPKEKVATKALPAEFREVLQDQDPSLRLALAKDAGRELFDNVTDVVKVPDTTIAGISYPTLKLTLKDKTTQMVAVDPDTHLLRRVSVDVRAQLESRHVPDIKAALYTVDYTTIKADATMKAEQFAWTPPAGAKDIKDAKAAIAADDGESATALVGKDVPDFKLPGMDGKMVSKADLAGKVYILDFWATWCGPCRQSLPHLDKLYNAQKGAGLKVYAVNLQEDKAKVEEFITSTKLSVPVLLDKEGQTSEPFKASGIPETVVVGKDGKIAKVFVGFNPDSTPEELKKAVEEALAK